MSLRAGFIAIGLVAAVVYIYGIHTHNLQLRQWSKPWPVAFMILEAARVNTSYGRWVTGALVFCVGGALEFILWHWKNFSTKKRSFVLCQSNDLLSETARCVVVVRFAESNIPLRWKKKRPRLPFA
jgi:hypothetical protein